MPGFVTAYVGVVPTSAARAVSADVHDDGGHEQSDTPCEIPELCYNDVFPSVHSVEEFMSQHEPRRTESSRGRGFWRPAEVGDTDSLDALVMFEGEGRHTGARGYFPTALSADLGSAVLASAAVIAGVQRSARDVASDGDGVTAGWVGIQSPHMMLERELGPAGRSSGRSQGRDGTTLAFHGDGDDVGVP